MEDLFLRPKEAKSIEGLGFKEDCFAVYCSNAYGGFDLVFPHHKRQTEFNPIAAATYQQAFKWFRQVHNTDSEISKVDEGYAWHTFKDNDERIASTIRLFGDDRLKYIRPTYEEAELACIEELISKHIQI